MTSKLERADRAFRFPAQTSIVIGICGALSLGMLFCSGAMAQNKGAGANPTQGTNGSSNTTNGQGPSNAAQPFKSPFQGPGKNPKPGPGEEEAFNRLLPLFQNSEDKCDNDDTRRSYAHAYEAAATQYVKDYSNVVYQHTVYTKEFEQDLKLVEAAVKAALKARASVVVPKCPEPTGATPQPAQQNQVGQTPGGQQTNGSTQQNPPVQPPKGQQTIEEEEVPANAPMDKCVVGSWVSTSVTSVMGDTGGDGIHLTIAEDGTEWIDYSGMKPVKGESGVSNQYSGKARGKIIASGGRARILSVAESNVQHMFSQNGGAAETNAVTGLGPGSPGDNKLDDRYECGATTLSFQLAIIRYAFNRQGGATVSK